MSEGRQTRPPEGFPADRIEVVSGLFITPNLRANWERWRRIRVVSLTEAVFLSFGMDPDRSRGKIYCWPVRRLHERRNLALMNLGPGGSIEGVGHAKELSPYELRLEDLSSPARVVLVSFTDWVVGNDMALAPGCPRSPPTSLARHHGTKEQQTRACVIGMLALALGDRLIASKSSGGRLKVSAIRDAALDAAKVRCGLKAAKRATLDKYIKEGLAAMEGEWLI